MINYDSELEQIPFYKFHPELLPFVGSRFNEYSILIVGESHDMRSPSPATVFPFPELSLRPEESF